MIELTQNSGFKWVTDGSIWVKGSFFDAADNYFEKEQLLDYFKTISTYKAFVEALKECNGVFSVVIKQNDEVWCAVDRNISFPIFYSLKNEGIIISDDAISIARNFEQIVNNKLQLDIYKSLGHTFGSETLINGINQLQCGQAIQFKKNSIISKEFYHNFSVSIFNSNSKDELLKQGYVFLENSFKRLVKSLNGRTAIVPLSGGFDSRVIVAGLKKQGYQKVICFTYGKKENNNEIELSKRVAKELNYKWIFVEYNDKLFDGFVDTKDFNDYLHFSSHLSSMFFLQEYFAVKYLKDNKLIPDDSIFIPGHSGDLIGGSQLIKVFNKDLSINDIPDTFIDRKCIYKALSVKQIKEFKQLIQTEISASIKNNGATVFEELDIREKISKVIFNSSNVFDFFDYEKRFPFWDLDLLNFFMSLPLEYREMKNIYDTILIKKYFEPLKIHFSTELQPSKKQLLLQRVKNCIKLFFPFKLTHYLLKKSDWKNYYEATLPLLNKMKDNNHKFKFRGKSFNEILIEYYVYSFKRKVKKIHK